MPPTLVSVQTPQGRRQIPSDIAANLGLTTTPVQDAASTFAQALAPVPANPLGGFGASDPLAQLEGNPALAIPGVSTPIQAPDVADPSIPVVGQLAGGGIRLPDAPTAELEVPAPTRPDVSTPTQDPAQNRFRQILAEDFGNDPNRVLDALFVARDEENSADFRAAHANDPIAVDETVADAPLPQPEAQSPLGLEPVNTGTSIVARMTGVTPQNSAAVAQALHSADPSGTDYRIMNDGSIIIGNNTAAVLASQGMFAPGAILAIQAAGQRAVFPEQNPGAGLGGVRVEEETSMTERPIVPQAVLDEYENTNAKLQALRQESLQGRLDLNRLQAEGFDQLARLRETQTRQMESEDAEGAAELRSRIDALGNTIQQLSENRINPDRFFGSGNGGFGRRMGAAIAIALGSIGQGLMGGPNQALAVIQQRIQDDIRAQEADASNARAQAGLQSNAISYFRQALGDERAAREAAMASEWEGAISRLRGVLGNAQDPILRANGNALIVGARAAQLVNLMNAHQGAWEITRRIRAQQRVAQSPFPASQAGNTQPRQAPRNDGGASLTVEDAPELVRRGFAGELPAPAPQRPRGQSQQPRRPRIQPPQRQQPLSSFSEPRNTRVEAAARLDEQSRTTPGQAPLPASIEEIVPGVYNRLPVAQQSAIRNVVDGHVTLEAALPRLIDIAREEGVEAIRSADSGEAAFLTESAMAGLRQLWNFGSLTAGERPFLTEIFEDPTRVSLRNFIVDNPGRLLGMIRGARIVTERKLGEMQLRFRTQRSVTEQQEVRRESSASADRTRRMEESNARAERILREREEEE